MNGASMSYMVRKNLVPMAGVDNPSNGYDTINEDIIERALIVVAGIIGTTAALESNGTFTASYLTDRATVRAKLSAIFEDSDAWTYFRVGRRQHNGRNGYLTLRDHYLGPNNADDMASAAEKILQNTVYHG